MARDVFLLYTQSFNSAARCFSERRCRGNYKKLVRQGISAALERLESGPRITCMDGIDVIREEKDNPGTQLFIDWPYVGIYRSSRNLYKVEMEGVYEHIKAAEELKDSKAAVVICGCRSPREGIPTVYDAILTGDEWYCFKTVNTYKYYAGSGRGKKKQRAEEYVWTNRVPEYAGLYLSLHDYKEHITFPEDWKKIKSIYNNGILSKYEKAEYEHAYQKLYGKSITSM